MGVVYIYILKMSRVIERIDRMKISDLTGAELDYWIAKADNLPVRWEFPQYNAAVERGRLFYDFAPEAQIYNYRQFQPSTNWSQGGPLLEKYETYYCRQPGLGDNSILHYSETSPNKGQHGPTHLIAAMRAIVASVYGDTINEN